MGIDDFLFEIKAVLELDSESTVSKYPAEQLALTERCMQMICNYKSRLEADTELWKQIKVHVSDYIAEITGIVNAFDTEHAEFSEDKDFIEHKQGIEDLKDKLAGEASE